jgi:hypothetical protein
MQGHPLFGQTIYYGRDRAKMMMNAGEHNRLDWYVQYWRALTEDHLWTAGLGRAQSFVTIPTDANVLFVGSGFGFLAETARSLGWTNIACIDDSNWIGDHKADLAYRWTGSAWVQDEPNASETIIQRNINNAAQTKNALKPAFGGAGEPDWIITESVLSGLTEPTDPLYSVGEGDTDEVTEFLDDCDNLIATGGTVLHMCDLTIRPPFNQHTLAEWNALRPAHRYAASGYYVQDWEIL